MIDHFSPTFLKRIYKDHPLHVQVESVSLPPPQHSNGSNSFEDNQAAMEVEEPLSEWKEPVQAPQPVATFQQPAAPSLPPVEQPQPVWKSPEPEVVETVETVEEAEEVGEVVVAEAEVATPESNAPRTWSSLVKSGGAGPAPVQGGKPPLAPQASLGRETGNKEGTPFSQGGGQGKPYRGQRGSSQGRSVSGTPGGGPQARPERFSKEEDGGRSR